MLDKSQIYFVVDVLRKQHGAARPSVFGQDLAAFLGHFGQGDGQTAATLRKWYQAFVPYHTNAMPL